MKKSLFLLLFLINGIAIAQTLEETIYLATERFIENQNTSTYNVLKQQETVFKNQLKTKDDQLAYVFLLCNKAYYLRDKTPLKAITSYEDAWSRYTKHKLSELSDYDIIEYCLKPLGNLYIKSGDYTNAESIIKQYIFLAEQSKSKKYQIAGAINLSKLYQTLGKHKSVIAIIERAIKTPHINTNQKTKLINIKNRSLIASGKMQPRKTLFKDTSVITNTYNSNDIKYQLALKSKNYKEALHLFNNKIVFIKKDTLSVRHKAQLAIEEAQLHYLLDNKTKALTELNQALKTLLPNFSGTIFQIKENLYADNTFIDIFDLLAVIQPNAKQALHCYDLSTHVSNLLNKNLTSQQSKIENFARNRIRSEKRIALLFSEYTKGNNKDYFVKALLYAENTKSQILKDVYKQKSLLQKHPNDSLLINEQKLLLNQERVTNALINEQLNTSKASNIIALNRQLNSISIELKKLKKIIKAKYKEAEEFNIEKLQQKLIEDNSTLINYFFGKNNIYQFVISGESLAFNSIELNEKKLNQIKAFNNLFENATIINNDIKNYTNRAFSLFNTLHLNINLSTKNLIIIPDGLLNFLPFEALLTSDTKSMNYSKMPFLINKQIVLYNVSATAYINSSESLNKPHVLGVFPVFENSNQMLLHSIDEATYIKKSIHSTVLLNEDASKDNFLKKASKYNTLHISTHAAAGSFAIPASITFADKIMPLNELYGLNLNTDLVVLSACETGVGKTYKGEGTMSIARGFQYSGVKNVLFSLWQINDLSTSQIMQSFYKNYSKNQSVYLANHNSKISYLQREDISNIKKSPYYWSAFVFYGDIKHPKNTNSLYLYIFGAIGVFFILLLIYKNASKHA